MQQSKQPAPCPRRKFKSHETASRATMGRRVFTKVELAPPEFCAACNAWHFGRPA